MKKSWHCNIQSLSNNCKTQDIRVIQHWCYALIFCFKWALKLHNPVRAAPEWSQVREQGNLRQKGTKEEGEEAQLTPGLFFASWRGDLFFWNDIILSWRTETIAALSTKRYYSALVNGPLWRVISWGCSVVLCRHHRATTIYSLYKTVLIIQNVQLTRSLQNWHRSFPPMKRVTSFQSFWKSTV